MTKQYLIWDLPLRLFHWSFATTIMALWYTAEQEGELIDLHMKLGYFVLGLVTFRIIWGFIGPKHARFSDFFPTPQRIKNYLTASLNSPKCTAGHNPLGAFMVFLMLALVLTQAISGLFIDDDIFSSGPYYGSVSKEIENLMSFLHHNVFDLILASIVLHVSAIFYYRYIKKIDLITPMITGKKSAKAIDKSEAISSSKLGLAIMLALLTAAFIYWLVVVNIPVSDDLYY
jgi:cytochrome b